MSCGLEVEKRILNLGFIWATLLSKSEKFKLSTNKVTFNQNNQTAESKENSIFESAGTTIRSEGFEITDNGDIILFNGKTILVLNK